MTAITINANNFATLPLGPGTTERQYLHSAIGVRGFSDPAHDDRRIMRFAAVQLGEPTGETASVIAASMSAENMRWLAAELRYHADEVDPRDRWLWRLCFILGYAGLLTLIGALIRWAA